MSTRIDPAGTWQVCPGLPMGAGALAGATRRSRNLKHGASKLREEKNLSFLALARRGNYGEGGPGNWVLLAENG